MLRFLGPLLLGPLLLGPLLLGPLLLSPLLLAPAAGEAPDSVGMWEQIREGVSHRFYATGDNVVIAFGCEGVMDELSQRWLERMMEVSSLASRFEVGHAYAVRGPGAGHIGIEDLINNLLWQMNGDLIMVIAHSAGSNVSNDFFNTLSQWDVNGATDGKIAAFNLDGYGGIPDGTVAKLKALCWVWARMASGLESMNAAIMKYHAELTGDGFEVDASSSGCVNSLCLHDAVVNTHPWNSEYFDVLQDYGTFDEEHEVQTQYLQALMPVGPNSAVS
ncbi:unnamed protein product [Darwinula stevensoni]|uniref:Uncharacterized protein n=1 Tax=Darwinula stevensoni TaxID=69355 RepID=A0A7R9A3M2_9CRUS|nr:unnamed protein product [Darwinula stevensoni]CAG0890881.1 unnamed protein product [Darwinula stevensoni]